MKSFKFFQKRSTGIIWRTAIREDIPLEDMDSQHIVNIMNMLRGPSGPIPDPYLGRSHYEWYRIFCDEIERRTGQNPRIR